MEYDKQHLENTKKKLNQVSNCFCMAKWMKTTLHLLNGRTHSCFLPPTHLIPLNEIAKDPSALHNTQYKKEQRKKMLEGQRPEECSMCWAIEDLDGDHYSDRILRGSEPWSAPFFEQVTTAPWNENFNPSYVEVSFSSTCNLKCSYCAPHVSTKWYEEIKQFGPYQLTEKYQDLNYLKENNLLPFADEDKNPYIDAFWKWWPDLYKNLMVFRITGGEPLLSKQTFKVLDWINEFPKTDLELDINSNLCVSDAVFDRFIESIKPILENDKVKSLRIYTSIDSYGKQAEYIRHGFDFARFQKNIDKYLSTFPKGRFSIMSTFNALSIVGYQNFLDWYLQLRKKYENQYRPLFLDIPHLTGPQHQSVRVLTPDYLFKLKQIISYVEQNGEFRIMEVNKLKRIYEWMKVPQDFKSQQLNQKNFFLFFSEHDRRRGTDFISAFPEMRDFWEHCQRLASY